VQYQDAGHVFGLPGEAPVLRSWHDALGSGIAYGGTEEGVISAADRWNTILSFIQTLG
jgi:hypothetical protein